MNVGSEGRLKIVDLFKTILPSALHNPTLLRNPQLLLYALVHRNLSDITREYQRSRQLLFSRFDGIPVKTKLGFELYLNIHDEFVSIPIWQNRVYEPSVTSVFQSIVKPGMTVLDIGANLGYYTVLASKLVGERGKVYAFEPEPRNYALLLRNVGLSSSHNVQVLNEAATDFVGITGLGLSDTNPGDHRLRSPIAWDRKEIQVHCTTVDDFLGQGQAVNLAKLDIQGAERKCLRGMVKTISSNPFLKLIVEFSPFHLEAQGSSASDFIDFVESLNFRFVDITPKGLIRRTKRELLRVYTRENSKDTNLLLYRSVS